VSAGGIGWVAMLLDRLDNIVDRSGYARVRRRWVQSHPPCPDVANR
jgi:hypothetical protein